jgi:2-phosphoglycerate kinase
MPEIENESRKIFWLGGSPCSGKSSISGILASRFDLDVYHVDDAFEIQAQSLNPDQQPNLSRWLASSWNERWMQPVEILVEEVIACYREHLALIVDDIKQRPTEKSLLVEGSALLPGEIARILPSRSQAIWIVPTSSFQREHYARREWARTIVERCDDPEVAFDNWMERDIRFAEWIEAEAGAHGLSLLKIDRSRTIPENAQQVARHFQLATD